MGTVAVEAIKIKRDSDSVEEVFEPNTDVTNLPTGELVESAVVRDTVTGIEVVLEVGKDLSAGTPVPTPPNNTTLVSAEVPYTSGGWDVMATLSDLNGYASVSAEWELKVNGTTRADVFVTGHNTTVFQIRFKAGTDQANLIKAGDTVLISHKIADSGIVKFIDQPVTNSLK